MITDEEQRWFEHQTDREREREMDREIAAEKGGDQALGHRPAWRQDRRGVLRCCGGADRLVLVSVALGGASVGKCTFQQKRAFLEKRQHPILITPPPSGLRRRARRVGCVRARPAWCRCGADGFSRSRR